MDQKQLIKNNLNKLLCEEVNVKGSKNLEAIEIINKFDYLQKALKYIILNNKSNDATYHNLNHLLTVLKYCYQGLMAEGIKDKEDIKTMLLAAIFHDFNHSMGKLKDDKNVEMAKKGIETFLKDENIEADLDGIKDLLDATQYPYIIEGKDLDEMQKIIRDADLMQVFEYNWIHQNISGLSNELNMSFIDFIKPQKKFLDTCEFNSKWGKTMKKEKWNDVIKKFDMLVKVTDTKLKSEK